MLKRVTERKWERAAPEWPDEVKPDTQLFHPRLPLRKLLVVMDAEVENEADPNLSLLGQLDGRLLVADLVKHDYIVLYRYADDGPPAGAGGHTVQNYPGLVHPGWVIAEEVDTAEGIQVGIRYSQSLTQLAWRGAPSNQLTIAERDENTGAYSEMTAEEAKVRRHTDARAYLAADAIGADLFITHRDYLLKSSQYSSDGVLVCGPEDALAFIGLYLRTQGEFRILSDFKFSRGLFYLAGTHQLLSSGQRWRRAIGQYSAGSGDKALERISWSLIQRVDRALEERDRLHAALNRRQNNDVRDEALVLLDTILLWFMSAFDVAARVANRVLGLGFSDNQVGWQRDGWRKKVEEICPGLAAVMGAGTSGRNVLTIVRLLRNSVHGAALQGAAYHNSRGPQQTIVGLPPDDEPKILAAMDAEGGRAAWGVVLEIPDYQVQLDPGVFIETAFRAVIPLLNELMDATPIEKLPYVDLDAPEQVARGGPYDNPFSAEIGKSIRWQLGL
jgi:hypothetical protein